MKRTLVILFVLVCHISGAQDFKNEAELKSVNQEGYYRIILTPEITSQLREDYSDVRIYSDAGKEIPYLLQSEAPLKCQELFREYEIIEKLSTPKCCTNIILHNKDKNKINNVSLSINNSDARKKARLTGSDDKQNWYIIKENFLLESVINSNETSEIKIVDFPLSEYEYFKIEINDSVSEPFKINKVGYYDTYVEYGNFLMLPNFSISQKDSSDKVSYIKLSQSVFNYMDRIKLTIQGPELFRRKASLCIIVKDKHHQYYSQIQEFEIRSNQDNIIYLDHYRGKDMFLLIQNNDNSPLTVTKAEGYQVINYLLASLSQNKDYKLKYGNQELLAPSYDLSYFKDNLPGSLGILYPTNFHVISNDKISDNKEFFQSQVWIWAAIAIVIGLLGFMSNKMIKEIKSEKI